MKFFLRKWVELNASIPMRNSKKIRPFWHILRVIFKTYPKDLGLGILFLMAINTIEMSQPIFLKKIVDKITQTTNWQIQDYFFPIGLLFMAYLGMSIARWLWRYFLLRAARMIESHTRLLIMQTTSLTPYWELNKVSTGSRISELSYDVTVLQTYIAPGLIILCDIFIYIPLISSVIYWQVGPQGLWICLPYLFLTFFSIVASTKMRKYFQNLSHDYSSLSTLSFEDISGIKFFRSHQLFAHRFDSYKNLVGKTLKWNRKINQWQIFLEGFVVIALFLALAILFFSAFYHPHLYTVGSMALCVALMDRLTFPFLAFSHYLGFHHKLAGSAPRLLPYFIKWQKEASLKSNAIGDEKISFQQIKIKELRIKNDDESLLLYVPSFELNLGDRVGVAGKIGSGKSLFLKLLSGIIPESQLSYEEFTFNGKPFYPHGVQVLPSLLGYCPQNAQIFESTIERNIVLHRPYDLNKLNECINASEMKQDLQSWKNQLLTEVGEKGITISGGQKQRLALARVLYGTPSLFLWDDIVSALDHATEEKIMKNLLAQKYPSAMVLATHRTSALAGLDSYFEIENKTLIQKGKYGI
ncbi:MAG: ABC transporter ATP-binding protein [Bacteriovoracaceae bacterium]|nr:ABC transporter ATP-binding protein [Bacteriovoracaceae bacterium]